VAAATSPGDPWIRHAVGSASVGDRWPSMMSDRPKRRGEIAVQNRQAGGSPGRAQQPRTGGGKVVRGQGPRPVRAGPRRRKGVARAEKNSWWKEFVLAQHVRRQGPGGAGSAPATNRGGADRRLGNSAEIARPVKSEEKLGEGRKASDRRGWDGPSPPWRAVSVSAGTRECLVGRWPIGGPGGTPGGARGWSQGRPANPAKVSNKRVRAPGPPVGPANCDQEQNGDLPDTVIRRDRRRVQIKGTWKPAEGAMADRGWCIGEHSGEG